MPHELQLNSGRLESLFHYPTVIGKVTFTAPDIFLPFAVVFHILILQCMAARLNNCITINSSKIIAGNTKISLHQPEALHENSFVERVSGHNISQSMYSSCPMRLPLSRDPPNHTKHHLLIVAIGFKFHFLILIPLESSFSLFCSAVRGVEVLRCQ